MDLQKILDRAKIGVMLHGSVFISTIAFSLRHKFNPNIKTARTDGRTIEYNPEFFQSLNPDERIFVIAHEAWHVALMHLLRVGDRDPGYYNKAADYVINQLLFDDDFDVPDMACQDSNYRGKSTNEIYDIILEEQDEPDDNNQDLVYGVCGTDGDEDNQGKQLSPKEKDDLENHIKNMLVKARTQSQMQDKEHGVIPAEVERFIDKLINPRLSWDNILQRFLTDKVKGDYTWARPNRRFMPEFYLPTQHSDSLAKITIAIDTSGSISKEDLTAILSEIQYIRDTMKPKELVIIDCDYQIHNIYDVSEDQHILDLEFTGGGGTSCTPVMEYCRDNPTTALVYFTDLYMKQWEEEMDFPILWIVYNNDNANPPVGEVTHYEINAGR